MTSSRAWAGWLVSPPEPAREPIPPPSSWLLASRAGLGSKKYELERAGSARLVSRPTLERTARMQANSFFTRSNGATNLIKAPICACTNDKDTMPCREPIKALSLGKLETAGVAVCHGNKSRPLKEETCPWMNMMSKKQTTLSTLVYLHVPWTKYELISKNRLIDRFEEKKKFSKNRI